MLAGIVAKNSKQEYTPALTCPPSQKVSQVEKRQAIARVACLKFCRPQINADCAESAFICGLNFFGWA